MARIRATKNQPADEGRGPQQAEEVDLESGFMPSPGASRFIAKILKVYVREHPDNAELCFRILDQEAPSLAASFDRILGLYERYVREYPEQAVALLERCRELTERYRPLGTERVLGLKEATLFTGFTRRRVWELAREGIVGESTGDSWRFSEAELQAYLERPGSRGPYKKRLRET